MSFLHKSYTSIFFSAASNKSATPEIIQMCFETVYYPQVHWLRPYRLFFLVCEIPIFGTPQSILWPGKLSTIINLFSFTKSKDTLEILLSNKQPVAYAILDPS